MSARNRWERLKLITAHRAVLPGEAGVLDFKAPESPLSAANACVPRLEPGPVHAVRRPGYTLGHQSVARATRVNRGWSAVRIPTKCAERAGLRQLLGGLSEI